MRTLLLPAFAMFISIASFSQAKTESQNCFVFNAGLGYRVTPVDLNPHYPAVIIFPVYYQRDQQVSGFALNMGVMYYLAKPKLGFELSNSLRYQVLYQDFEFPPYEDRAALTSDYHFTINKFLPLRKNMLKTGIGYSLMNRGSKYSYITKIVTTAGDTAYLSNEKNFNFSTFNISIGYQVNQFAFELINRFTTQHHFYSLNQIYIPEMRFTYSLRLKRNKIFE